MNTQQDTLDFTADERLELLYQLMDQLHTVVADALVQIELLGDEADEKLSMAVDQIAINTHKAIDRLDCL